MTRYSDLMCEDLFGCTHEPETPVAEGGEILYWICRCGEKKSYPEKQADAQEEKPQP